MAAQGKEAPVEVKKKGKDGRGHRKISDHLK